MCSRSTPNTPKKTFERVIASGNHLLTQVKDNQPSLAAGSSWERRAASRPARPRARPRAAIAGKPANCGVSGQGVVSPYALGPSSRPCFGWSARSASATPRRALPQTRETVFWISSASGNRPRAGTNGFAPIGASRTAATTCATPLSPKTLPHPQEPRHRRRLRSFAYNLIRASGCYNIRNARWRAALNINLILEMRHLH